MHESYIRIVPDAKRAVLMVHGIVGTPRHFDFLLDVIPENVSVMNVLLAGHGGTVRDFSNGSLQAWRKTVADALQQLCASHEEVFLVGHSMGTLLTAELVEKYPQAKGFLYLNVPLWVWISPRMMPSNLRWCFGRLREDNFMDRGLMIASGVEPDKRLWRYLGWIPRFLELLVLCKQSRSRFETLNLSGYVFQSQLDEMVLHRSDRLLQKNSAIRFTLLPDCGHFAYTEEARALMRNGLKELLENQPES